MAWLELEFIYYDITVQHISHYTMKTPLLLGLLKKPNLSYILLLGVPGNNQQWHHTNDILKNYKFMGYYFMVYIMIQGIKDFFKEDYIYLSISLCVCVYVCMYVCMCVCVCVCVCVYIYIHTHTPTRCKQGMIQNLSMNEQNVDSAQCS